MRNLLFTIEKDLQSLFPAPESGEKGVLHPFAHFAKEPALSAVEGLGDSMLSTEGVPGGPPPYVPIY